MLWDSWQPTVFYRITINDLHPVHQIVYVTPDCIFNGEYHISSSKGRFNTSALPVPLTHWGRVTHKCVSEQTIIGSDNGLSPGRRQDIIWNNDGILSIGFLGTNFSEILIEILTFSFKKMRLKVSSAKRRPFWLGLNELNLCITRTNI